MKPESRSLALAFGLSLLLHGLPLIPVFVTTPPPKPQPPSPLQARLAPLPPQAPIRFDEIPEQETSAPKPPPAKPLPKASTTGPGHPAPIPRNPMQQAQAQVAKHLLYPPEAARLGQEGDTLVKVFLDENGNALAARVEASSGHGLLDAAATRAAKLIRGLPDHAPREVVLPVRFRLR